MTWTDRLKAEVPLGDRAQFLTDLQALVAALRVGRDALPVTPLLQAHSDLAVAYMDDGVKKERARGALTPS